MALEVMTVTEVAEYLRVNPQTVYRKAKAGELPVLRIGRAIRFRRTDLDAWLGSDGKRTESKGSARAESRRFGTP